MKIIKFSQAAAGAVVRDTRPEVHSKCTAIKINEDCVVIYGGLPINAISLDGWPCKFDKDCPVEIIKSPGYTARQIAARLPPNAKGQPVSPQRIFSLTRFEGWPSYKSGQTRIYTDVEAIEQYIELRWRGWLMQLMGVKFAGRYECDDYDIECPICGGFAVEHPDDDGVWACVEGHRSE